MIRGRYFTEGSYGRQVALLYRIDDAHYRAALDAARGQYARAEASIRATRLQSQRYTDLAKINAVSRQEADNAQAAAKQAQADVSAQRAAVDAAAINLRYTQVRAPISGRRSEEHTSELQSLMRISYAVFCLKKKKLQKYINKRHTSNR